MIEEPNRIKLEIGEIIKIDGDWWRCVSVEESHMNLSLIKDGDSK